MTQQPSTHVIILAQGQQKRLPMLPVAKQMLPLPACNDTPILHRTLRQLWHLLGGINVSDQQSDTITVVAWYPLVEQLNSRSVIIPSWPNPDGTTGEWRFYPATDTLPDPGNSSLKGIARFLAADADRRSRRWALRGQQPPDRPEYDRTVVLLGDVVYSWACLDAIFADRRIVFAGTSDISPSGGELWGLAWKADAEELMMSSLVFALAKHPPFDDTYQPGQMRRWMWSVHPELQKTERYAAIDDYTRDIDLPEHLDLLPALSEAAHADDQEHGVTW